jgi:hypothetical protein
MKKKSPASTESERQKRVAAAISKRKELSAQLEKLRNGRPRVELSEDELEARWRHLMQSGKFIDEN